MVLRVLEMIDEAAVGGGQKHVLDLSRTLDPSRFEVHVACEGSGYLADAVRQAGLPFHPVAMSNRPDLRALVACLRILDRIRPGLVHTHGGTAGFYGRLAARRRGLPTVHTYHGLHSLRGGLSLRRRVFHLVDRMLASGTARLICVSRADEILARKSGLAPPDRTRVIHNGIDTSAFSASRLDALKGHGRATDAGGPDGPAADGGFADAGGPDGPAADGGMADAGGPDAGGFAPLIGCVGRLSPEKGHRFLVRAMPLILNRHPRARLQLVGEGPQYRDLEVLAGELGVRDRVELPGAIYDTPEVLGRFDIFVLPSLWEGLPMTILEAMAAGVPIAASAVDGVREILEDGVDGLLAVPGDPESLAAAINRLLDDPETARRMALSAREKVRRDFDLSTMTRATAQVYLEAVSSRSG